MTTAYTNFDVPTLNEFLQTNWALNPSDEIKTSQGEWLVFFTSNSMMETAYDRANQKVLNEILENKGGWDCHTIMSRGTGYTTFYTVDPNGEAFKEAIEAHCTLADYPLLRDESVMDCEHCGECFPVEIDEDHFPYCSWNCEREVEADHDEDYHDDE